VSTRFVKGKARTETPRMKDLPQCVTDRDPADGRTAGGRFGKGNRASIGQGFKALVRKGLGDPDDPAVGELVRQATRMYMAILRSLPSDGPGVRPLVASQARHAVMATFFANEAARFGLATPEGLKLAEAARAHDTTAQRLSVTAYDRAVREAAAKAKPRPCFDITDEDRAEAERAIARIEQGETHAEEDPNSGQATGQ
jgi:hypothetical protein